MNETKAKSRLLILSSSYPRWKGDHEPSFVHQLGRRLVDDFEIQVIAPHAQGALSEETLDGVDIKRFRYAPEKLETLVNDGGIINNLRRSRWKWLLVPLFLFFQSWTTWQTIRRWHPDVIHAHWLFPQGLIVALLSLVFRSSPPYLVTSHGADLHTLCFWPMPALKRFVVRRAAAVTVVSSAMLDVMKAQGIPTEDVQVEPMGVDLMHRFTPDASVSRSKDEILFVGRLVEKKGLRYLVEAMPAILEKHPGGFLTVAGFGPEEPALRRQVESLGLKEKVCFLGAVPQEKLPALYRRAAVFVAPFVEAAGGDQEGLGLVTVEAIGCGCPVVVSDLPAVADVVDEPLCRVEPRDAAKLGEAVNRVLAASEQDFAHSFESLRRRVTDRFVWCKRARAYNTLLGEVIKEIR